MEIGQYVVIMLHPYSFIVMMCTPSIDVCVLYLDMLFFNVMLFSVKLMYLLYLLYSCIPSLNLES